MGVRIMPVSILRVQRSMTAKTGKTEARQERAQRVRVCAVLPEDCCSRPLRGGSHISATPVPGVQHLLLVCAGTAHM